MKPIKTERESIVVPHVTADDCWCNTNLSKRRFNGGPEHTIIIKIKVVILYFFIALNLNLRYNRYCVWENTGDGSLCSLNFSYYCKANPRQPTNLPYWQTFFLEICNKLISVFYIEFLKFCDIITAGNIFNNSFCLFISYTDFLIIFNFKALVWIFSFV